MTREEKINRLKDILAEINEDEDAVCYLTSEDNELIESAIEALEQHPCKDAISRKYAIDKLKYGNNGMAWFGDAKTDLAVGNFLENLPPVTPKESKTGQWVLLDKCSNSGYYCSECHKKVVKEGWSNTVKKIKYCPNCGAKMIEPQESEDKE